MSEETKRSRMSPPSSTRQLPPQSSLPPPSASVPQQMTPPVPPLQYEEPEDAASPTRPVCFEVVKNGVILETTPLMSKSLWVVGRLPICDLSLEHQSISRYHAVIQSRQDGSLLLYDMDSSHGTSLNKTALPPRRHVRLTNGDMIRFGQSTRIYIVQGLEQQQQDYEDDAGKGVDHKNKMHLSVPVEEEHEVTWGFREDAVEPGSLLLSKLDDIQADPDAYYHRDPKKAFRTWCEANHHDSEFEVLEEKFGRSRGFVARITLSLDGGVEELECVGQGDRKKEAEARAALDACIKLDKLGILRSGGNSNALKKEKRRIKEMLKNMDDDSDSYYDRTDRRDKVPTSSTKSKTLAVKAETFESLSVKHIDIFKRISVLEVEIESAPKDLDVLLDLDDLDQYVKQLQRNVEKQKISNLKSSLTGLRQELQDVDRLLKIVRPDFDPSNLDTENKALSPPPPPPPAAVTAAPPSSSSSLSSFSLPSPLPILTITPTKRKLHEEEVKLPPPPSLEDKQPLAGKRKRVADVMTQQAAAEHLSVESEEMVDAVGRQQQQQDVRKLNSAYGY